VSQQTPEPHDPAGPPDPMDAPASATGPGLAGAGAVPPTPPPPGGYQAPTAPEGGYPQAPQYGGAPTYAADPQPGGAQQPGYPQSGYQNAGYQGGPSAAQPLSDSDSRMWAMLGHVGGIILGFIAPLITWLVFRERSAFVDDQGKESLNFQITVLIAYVATWIIAAITLGFLFFLPFLVWVATIVFCIMAGIAANRGERYRYPFALRLIK